jgi:hypothetical protein
MARDRRELRLGKGVALVMSRLKRLPRSDDVWEADFEGLPQPMTQKEEHYLGMVVSKRGSSLLAELTVHEAPSVNDLATLLALAMSRPLVGIARRPKLVYFRGEHEWRELVPVLNDIGIDVGVERKLSRIEDAYRQHLQRLREEQKAGVIQPSSEQWKVETMFPAVARYVMAHGYVEIGDQRGFGFVVRANSHGAVDFQDDRAGTLAEAMAVLEAGLARWFAEQEVEIS